jgi:hypothetical protein
MILAKMPADDGLHFCKYWQFFADGPASILELIGETLR